jgi:hypothetical protein
VLCTILRVAPHIKRTYGFIFLLNQNIILFLVKTLIMKKFLKLFISILALISLETFAQINNAVVPSGCGFHWGFNPPVETNYDPNNFTKNFNGFQASCLISQTNPNPPPILNQCNINICNSELFLAYSAIGSTGVGLFTMPSYTLYVFNSNINYSLAVNNYTVALNFPNTGSYTIAAIDASNPCTPPPVSNTLQPTDVCSCTYLVVNYVGAPNCDFSISPTPVCAGQPFCFFNVNQNPSEFTSNIVIFGQGQFPNGCVPNGLAAGTYTLKSEVYILDLNGDFQPGCFCSKTQTITVNPVPNLFETFASPATGCVGETTTLTAFASGANSFTWLPGPILNNPATVTISANQVYTVLAGNGTGCNATKTLQVTAANCCRNPNQSAIFLKNITIVPFGTPNVPQWNNVVTPGGTYANLTLASPSNNGFSLLGNYTVDGFLDIQANNVNIIGANIFFNEASVLYQRRQMRIERSYLHGCLTMWQGIQSYDRLTVISSIIEDAENGIYPYSFFKNPHKGIFIENSIFNVNKVGINLNFVTFTNQGGSPAFSCKGSIFTSKVLPNSLYASFTSPSTYVNTIAPNLSTYQFSQMKGSTILNIPGNQIGNVGILLNNVIPGNNGIIIGETAPGNAPTMPVANELNKNWFVFLQHGIRLISSKAEIINARFHDYTGSGPAFAGVYHNNSVVKIGSAPFPLNNNYNKSACTFSNCNYGVYATVGGVLEVLNNTFNTGRRAIGVEFANMPQTNLSIKTNTFNECQLDMYAFDNGVNAKIIFENNFASGSYTVGSRRHHVFINQLSPVSSATYNIVNNTFNGKDIGVAMLNAANSNIVNNVITTNMLSILPNPNVFYNGIELSNVQFTWINDNVISCAFPNVNLNNRVNGISSNITFNNTYACNTILNQGVSMKFQGTSPSNIWKNSLNENPSAENLFGIWINNSGVVGPILRNNIEVGGNRFGDFDYSNGGWDTYSSINSQGSNILYTGPNFSTNVFNPWLNGNLFPAIPFTKSTGLINNTFNCGQGPQGQSISPGVPPFFGNTLNFGTNTANAMLIGRKGIYEFFKHSAINTNTLAGANTFTANCANSCIGTFYTIDSLIATETATSIAMADGINTGINPGNIVEQTQKSFNSIYCNFKLNNNTLSTAQITQLQNIAQQCPFTDGASVYQARALLTQYDSTEYYSACEFDGLNNTSSARENVNTAITDNIKFLETKVYPNPAKNELFVSCEEDDCTVFILAITGQLIMQEKINGSQASLNIEKLDNGTYLLQIINKDGAKLKTEKLIISK